MMSNLLLTFTAILIMKACVVETQRSLETSPYTAESKDGQLLRQKRESDTYTVHYIVVVEVQVSEVILIEKLKSTFSLQLDDSTMISDVNITTVCQLNDTEYQCRCEDQYFWPCDKCVEYGRCSGTSESSCYCINGVPNDEQFCQPLNEMSDGRACPTPPPLQTPLPTTPPATPPQTPLPTSPTETPTSPPQTPLPTTPPETATSPPQTPLPTTPTETPTSPPQTPLPTTPPETATSPPQTPLPTTPPETPTSPPQTPLPTTPPETALPPLQTPLPTTPLETPPQTPLPTSPTETPTSPPQTPLPTTPPETATSPPQTPLPTTPTETPTSPPQTPLPTTPPETATSPPQTPLPTTPPQTPTSPPQTPLPTTPPETATSPPQTPLPTTPTETPTSPPQTPLPTTPPETATSPPQTPLPTTSTETPTSPPQTPLPTTPPETATSPPQTPLPTTPLGTPTSPQQTPLPTTPQGTATSPPHTPLPTTPLGTPTSPQQTPLPTTPPGTATSPQQTPLPTTPLGTPTSPPQTPLPTTPPGTATPTLTPLPMSPPAKPTTPQTPLPTPPPATPTLKRPLPTAPPATPPIETSRNISLTIDEKFDIALTNQASVKYYKYKTTLENAIDNSYRLMAGYKLGSVRVLRFRPGSVIADFTITTTMNELDFRSANSELSKKLNADGFNVVENAFAYSEEYDLIQSPGTIYPLQDVQLNCAFPTGVMGNIQWQVGGANLFLNPVKYNILNNNRTLKILSVSAADSGTYQCITEINSLRFIQWQRIVIQPYPNIQVDPDKVFRCDNLSIPLQCCAHRSYTIQWTKDFLSPVTPPGRGSGCILYNYTVQKQDCEAGDQKVIFTCRLSDNSLSVFNYSSKNTSISITSKAFSCADGKFGTGNVNQVMFRQCDGDEIGIQRAVCNESGQWSIISNNCTLRVIQDLADRAEHLNIEEVPQFVANLSTAAEKSSEDIATVPVNLLKVVDLLSQLADISKAQSFTVDRNMMVDYLKTVEVITSVKSQETWKSFNTNNTNNVSCVLLQSIETIGSSLSNENFSITTSNIRLKRNLNNLIQGMFANSSTQIAFPETGKLFPVTVIVFSELSRVLPVRNAIYSDSRKTQTSINGDIVVVKGESTINAVSLSFDMVDKSLGNPQCVFWNFGLLNGSGAWDSTGCELKLLSNQTERVTCECNHTTSFSILMSPFYPDSDSLAYITYIGVGISLGCLVLCLIIEGLVWKSVSKTDTSYMRHVSTVNIALSLLLADICFIIGAAIAKKGQKTPVGPCSTVTFFIHFFYLALFFWMLLSALLLLYRTVIVFSRMSRTMMTTIAFTVGYGAPLIIAVVTVAATSGNGGYIQEENACWLNWYKSKAILAFVIPALVIVAINLLVLIMIVCKILKSGIKATIQRDEKHTIVMIARCVAILTPLFGLTWGFGIGTMVSSAFGIHVVFAVLNSLQGFFILVFGTLLDSKIFRALGRWKNVSSNLSGSIFEDPSSSKGRRYFHMFPRRYVYDISTADHSLHTRSSYAASFKFTDK